MTVDTASSTSSAVASDGSRSFAANVSVSRTVDSANSASSCSTYAEMRDIFVGVATSSPFA